MLDASLVPRVVAKYLLDRAVIKEVKQRQAEELRVLEELQSKREQFLIENAGMSEFSFFVDLFINGRDGKAEKKKEEENISLNQAKIEAWLLKMLRGVGEGIKTEFGTVYLSRKESVTCADFDMFVDSVMLKDAAAGVIEAFEVETGEICPVTPDHILKIIHDNMHLEMLTKAVRKESVLELMGDQNKDGSRPNPPPPGVNYTAIQSVGVRKPSK